MKYAALALACLACGILGGVAGTLGVAYVVRPAVNDAPTAPMPKPTPASSGEKVLRAERVEITDQLGRVSIVLFADGKNIPTAVVNDEGQARTINLAKVARLAK